MFVYLLYRVWRLKRQWFPARKVVVGGSYSAGTVRMLEDIEVLRAAGELP